MSYRETLLDCVEIARSGDAKFLAEYVLASGHTGLGKIIGENSVKGTFGYAVVQEVDAILAKKHMKLILKP